MKTGSLFFWLVIATVGAAEIVCVDQGKIETIKKNVTTTKNESFCFSKQQVYFLQKKCHLSQQCLALKALSPDIKEGSLNSAFGRDEFKLCRVFKGDPSIVRYHDGKQWHNGSICSFSDNSFIGIDHLALRNQRIRK